MGAAELLALLASGRQIINWVMNMANLSAATGAISQEELQIIKDKAGISDSAWDEAVAAARARLGG